MKQKITISLDSDVLKGLEENKRDDPYWNISRQIEHKVKHPILCPVWQCGGHMEMVERDPPVGKRDEYQEYPGDWQVPDLVCQDCGAIYGFKRFKKSD